MKKGIKLLFAMLAIAGTVATLTACSEKQSPNSYSSSIDNNKSGYEQVIEDEDIISRIMPDKNGDQEVTPVEMIDQNDQNDETIDQNEEDQTETQIDEQEIIQQQLENLESAIESELVQKLNTKFEDNLVENVDVKYFSLEQNNQLNTTFFANGTIKFVNEEQIHDVKLGLDLDGNAFNSISPIYYITVDQTKNLAENYDVQNLTAVQNYISDQTLEFNSAELDGENWNLNNLTSAQIENQMEQDYCAIAKKFFKEELNTEYFKEIDFKYISTEHNLSLGYMLHLNAKASNIYTDSIEDLSIQIIVTKDDYDYLNSTVLIGDINQNADLKDNYSAEQLNEVIKIANKDTSYIRYYKLGEMHYNANEERDHTL